VQDHVDGKQQFDVFIPKDVSPPYDSQKSQVTVVERPKVDREDTTFSDLTTISAESEPLAPEIAPRVSSPYSSMVTNEPEHDIPISTPAEEVDKEDEEAPGACDICGRDFTRREPMYSCPTCLEGSDEEESFDLCKGCKESGVECPNDDGDGGHDWKAYVLRGETYQLAPIREILPSDLPIIRAVKNKNAKTLTSLAKNKRALVTRDEEGDTPLHLAIRLGFEDMVKILLNSGADLELLDNNRLTPLMLAIKYFYPRIVMLLLGEGADVNRRDGEEGETALHMAAAGSNKEGIKILLGHKAIIDTEFEGRTPLLETILQCDVECAAILLDAGADPNFGYEVPGASPLVHAIKEDFYLMVLLLLSYGAKIDAEDSNRYSVLHWAASENSEEACITLLDAGAQANCYDTSGQTPLMIAASAGHLEIVAQLLKKGNPSVNERSFSKWTALTQAATAGHLDIVKLLIQHGATGNPTPFKKWKDFPFSASIPPATKWELLEIVRRVKHMPE
jgi:ankyrin repeat protein